jgi:hypothetical protein
MSERIFRNDTPQPLGYFSVICPHVGMFAVKNYALEAAPVNNRIGI